MGSLVRSSAFALALLACAGCSEHALIRSTPPGARFYVNDALIGTTPVEYSCTREQFSRPQHFRLELDGYNPMEGELRHHVKAGRIVAADLTLGISLIFKRPTGLRDRYDFSLVPQTPVLEPVAAPR